MNKGKRSIAIDVKTARGREIAQEIIAAPGEDAGLFITNLAVPGWTDYETLRARRDDLCMVSLRGDRRGRPAVDYTVNPALGFPDATGPAGSSEPVCHVLPAWDCIAGNMVVSGLLAAERHRLRRGAGQCVDLNLKDAAAAMLGNLGILARGPDQRRKPQEARQYALRGLRAGFRHRMRAADHGDRAHRTAVEEPSEGHRHGECDG